jgi:RNA polymerase sigma-70 factor (ECF subfamily)
VIEAAQHEDERLCVALRAGDERAFAELVGRYHSALLRLATVYVRSPAVAEDVVQETWLGVIGGIDRFEGRSSLKTWIFRILENKAKTRGTREARSVPFSALGPGDDEDGPSVEPGRFFGGRHAEWPGHWASPPGSWDDVPESRLLGKETRAVVRDAIAALPPLQARVISLRDIEGWSSGEVCELLDVSEVNQRVLLHRARSTVRRALERYLDALS